MLANGDWTQPINYAEGTLYFRAEVREMPSNQDMRLQFCFWQQEGTDRFALETCGSQQPISFRGSTVVAAWSQEIGKMWKKNGVPLDWSRARYRNGVAIKNPQGLPVSDYNGWNWNGEDPSEWYPMDLRFTVVVVEKGKTFSGWENYIP